VLGVRGRGEWFSIVLSFVFERAALCSGVRATFGRKFCEVHFARAALEVSGASFMVVPTEHVIWDRRKPRSNLIQSVGRSTFRTHTDFQAVVRRSNPQIVTAAPMRAVAVGTKFRICSTANVVTILWTSTKYRIFLQITRT
jgi:hypothetical protein